MTVKSAKVALDVLRSSGISFDFVLTNVHMPEMDGFQLQQEIAKEFGIPVGCEFIIIYILHETKNILYYRYLRKKNDSLLITLDSQKFK